MTRNDLDASALSASLGLAIRVQRKALGLRLVDVARAADVSQAFLSQIENGAAASMFTHYRIALALDTTLQSLLDTAATPEISVVRRDNGDWLPLTEGMTIRTLVTGPDHAFEANETVAEPGSTTGEPFTHAGEEIVIVLEGTVVYTVGQNDPVELHPGDIAAYPSELPHAFRTSGHQNARLIVVGVPGSFITGSGSQRN